MRKISIYWKFDCNPIYYLQNKSFKEYTMTRYLNIKALFNDSQFID